MDWKKTINRLETEAQEILREYGGPKLDCDDRLHLAATLVVFGIKQVKKYADASRIDLALNTLLNVTNAYDDMCILKNVPAYDRGLFLTGPPKTYKGMFSLYDDLQRGAKNLKTVKKNHEELYGSKVQKEKRSDEYKREVKRRMDDGLSKTQAVQQTAAQFGVTPRTIFNHLKRLYRATPKKRPPIPPIAGVIKITPSVKK